MQPQHTRQVEYLSLLHTTPRCTHISIPAPTSSYVQPPPPPRKPANSTTPLTFPKTAQSHRPRPSPSPTSHQPTKPPTQVPPSNKPVPPRTRKKKEKRKQHSAQSSRVTTEPTHVVTKTKKSTRNTHTTRQPGALPACVSAPYCTACRGGGGSATGARLAARTGIQRGYSVGTAWARRLGTGTGKGKGVWFRGLL